MSTAVVNSLQLWKNFRCNSSLILVGGQLPPKFWLLRTDEETAFKCEWAYLTHWEAVHCEGSFIGTIAVHPWSIQHTAKIVFCLITAAKSVSIVQGQHCPKVHIASLSRGEKRNNWAPSSITSAKTITIWNFFSPVDTVNKTCRVAGCQRTNCCCTQLSK